MDVRAQVSMVFHLDKCIGCHTCSVACKNIWTDRPGAEYMWWNNVETKPGTGYPTRWEDQEKLKGGWRVTKNKRLALRSQNKLSAFLQLFYNPNQPGLDKYYEPWTYRYADLFDAPASEDQPTAIPISQITGDYIDIKAGPNWDDDLSGSPLYAERDINLHKLTDDERSQLFEIERLVMMYVPRMCNHCANPSCVAACPSGALYKRGEDGIVLVNQQECKSWRSCVAACPYKKVYYNWQTGKSEKCILCYPRLESGQVSACFHSCVGRARYLGVLLYDADRLVDAMTAPENDLIEAHRSILCDPFDPEVIAAAARNGISDETLAAAQQSPVWKYVVQWKLALPLHIEYRTAPMLFYVPPLLPVVGKSVAGSYTNSPEHFFAGLKESRLPIQYLANLFSAGNTEVVEAALRKLVAVRYYMRTKEFGDLDEALVHQLLDEARTSPEEIEEIYAMTAIAGVGDRYTLPAVHREEAIGSMCDPAQSKGRVGFGLTPPPRRGV